MVLAFLVVALALGLVVAAAFSVRAKGRRAAQAAATVKARDLARALEAIRTEPRHGLPGRADAPRPERAPVCGLDFDITYGDADGVVTRRQIRLKGVERSWGAVHLFAHCALRDDERTFRADRMLSVRTTDGRHVADPVAYFGDMAVAVRAPSAGHVSAMAKARPGLAILVWIARGNHDLSERELDAMIGFIGARIDLGRGAAAPWEPPLARLQIEGMRPLFEQALGAKARLAFGGREEDLVKRFAAQIVSADGAPEERAAKRFARMFGAA